jgi:hypothetical protein
LLREREYPGPAACVPLLLDASEQALVQPLDQRIELAREVLRRRPGEAALGREGHAPHLRAAFGS